jgi:hypothetical protein
MAAAAATTMALIATVAADARVQRPATSPDGVAVLCGPHIVDAPMRAFGLEMAPIHQMRLTWPAAMPRARQSPMATFEPCGVARRERRVVEALAATRDSRQCTSTSP